MRDDDEGPYEVGFARVLNETLRAILVELEDREVWIPKSVIHDDSEVYKSDTEGTLIVKEWFAEKEGL